MTTKEDVLKWGYGVIAAVCPELPQDEFDKTFELMAEQVVSDGVFEQAQEEFRINLQAFGCVTAGLVRLRGQYETGMLSKQVGNGLGPSALEVVNAWKDKGTPYCPPT